MKYREIKVKCYGTGESGPFAELENGRRVYGLTGVAPELLAALMRCSEVIGHNSCSDGKTPNGFVVALEEARAAIVKAREG